ncbi:MAG: ABC transporter ATP-binding protein [Candidatus Aminicenantes bacterium]|nr:ABC transporter ATP-binding protein [Candidatus Aminicenantes bacterium]
MIKLENISKQFQDTLALDNICFEVSKAKMTILAGPDGSGKSTLFRIILGLLGMDKGHIFFDGDDIGGNFSLITSRTGYMPERFSLYPDLNVEENLNFFADIHQIPRRQREERKETLLKKTGMFPFIKRRAGNLSGGMKQKLSLSAILLSAPECVILDEPTTGVDPLSRIEFYNILNELKKEGKTLLLSTPYLDDAEKGDIVVFINRGRIIKKGAIQKLKKNFPSKTYSILPRGNVLDVLDKLQKDDRFKNNVYLKGQYIKYLGQDSRDISTIPHIHLKEEKPRLEDIYIYYEKQTLNTYEDGHD